MTTYTFLQSLDSVLELFASSDNDTSSSSCESEINHYRYHQLVLVPSILIALAFAFTKPRKFILLDVLWGRPCLIYPMDSLTRSATLSYACAFGATASLVYKISLERKYAIETDGNRSLKSLIALASMFIYGMMFFPMFASLAIGSAFAYGLGALYVWMICAVEIYKLSECQEGGRDTTLSVFRALPSILCLAYLSISMPVRMVQRLLKKKYFTWKEDMDQPLTLDDIRVSYSGKHVAKLLRKPKIVLKPPPEGRWERIKLIIRGLIKRFVYFRKKGFRYPTRIVSVMVVGLFVVYTLTTEFLATVPEVFDNLQEAVLSFMDISVGRTATAGESEHITQFRDGLWVTYRILHILRVCIIICDVAIAVYAVISVLHMMASYRSNLLALYRGDHSHIPPASLRGNASHCVNSIKYAGYQVGYIIWGYLIQSVVLALACCIAVTVGVLIYYEFTDWIVELIQLLWPIALVAIMIAVIQFLLCWFVFLQDRGAYLALDNRRGFFNFTYFMFFYNIFLGLASCLLRIVKAMGIGILMLARLDHSTLPRKFEFFDPGFSAYVGFLQVEYTHTHPVLVVFVRLMYLGLHNKRQASGAWLDNEGRKSLAIGSNGIANRTNGVANGTKNKPGDVKIDMKEVPDEKHRRKMAARFNWHVTYTLLHNPDIRVMRKGYLQMLRQARQLGVHIPVSDRQADIDFKTLQTNIQEAKEKLAPPSKKNNKVAPS